MLLSIKKPRTFEKINLFFHRVIHEIRDLPIGGLALYLARTRKATPLHSHVFSKYGATPNQLDCWFPRNNVKFPKFEFVAGSAIGWAKWNVKVGS